MLGINYLLCHVCLYIYRVSQKKRGAFDGLWRRIELLDHRQQIFSCSQQSNLDHKTFPNEISRLMHLLEKIFFVRLCMGLWQTGEIFDQVPSAF